MNPEFKNPKTEFKKRHSSVSASMLIENLNEKRKYGLYDVIKCSDDVIAVY